MIIHVSDNHNKSNIMMKKNNDTTTYITNCMVMMMMRRRRGKMVAKEREIERNRKTGKAERHTMCSVFIKPWLL